MERIGAWLFVWHKPDTGGGFPLTEVQQWRTWMFSLLSIEQAVDHKVELPVNDSELDINYLQAVNSISCKPPKTQRHSVTMGFMLVFVAILTIHPAWLTVIDQNVVIILNKNLIHL